VLQPAAIDLLNPAAARTSGQLRLAAGVRAGGSAAAVQRYERDFAALRRPPGLRDEASETLWRTWKLHAAVPGGARRWRGGARFVYAERSGGVMQSFPGPAVARAGSGVCYGYFERAQAAKLAFRRAPGADGRR
jgi:hypothetical protein